MLMYMSHKAMYIIIMNIAATQMEVLVKNK
jgi:hypothetical protein